MDQLELKVTTRHILGKKVRFLRRQGITPAHLFGHNIESVPLECETALLQRVLSQAGKTRLINLSLDKAKNPRNVIAREVQRDPITRELLHVDFYEVSMAEKISCEVPIVLVGEAPALKLKDNMLTQELDSLEIECLPGEIPQSIQVDLSPLAEADQAVRVKDLTLEKGITILTNPETLIARVSVRAKVEEEVVAEEAAAAPTPEEKPEEAGEKAGEEQSS